MSRSGDCRGTSALAVFALLGVLSTAVVGAAEAPTGFQRLVKRVMLHPESKNDAAANHISYSTTTKVFRLPVDPAKPIDGRDPATFTPVFAEVTVSDREPLALAPEQLGAEDALLIVLRTEGTRHIFWKIRDAGLKGPAATGSKQLVELFGENQDAKYKDVVDRINAALDAEAAGDRAK
jgi:hypothetical protein